MCRLGLTASPQSNFACYVSFIDKYPEITGQAFTKLIGNCLSVIWDFLDNDFGAVLQRQGDP